MEGASQLLFLCTGNYYRSRFAEALFNWEADRLGLGWRAFSRGLALEPSNTAPISPYTAAYLRQLGIPHEPYHRAPRDTTPADLEQARHIVAVKTAEHHPLIARRFPAWLDRVEFWDIHDIDCASPADALPLLEIHVRQLLKRLAVT